ncbi:MAG: PHP domain-containing protein, partial [Cyclobacteriaceae bacterium]
MYLIYDTETTGLPKNYKAPVSDSDNWPRLVQIAWQLHGSKGELLEADNLIARPDGFDIPYSSEKVHGISTKRAQEEGVPLDEILQKFAAVIEKSELIIGHNIEFDLMIMGAEYHRKSISSKLFDTTSYCTKEATTNFVRIPGGRGGQFKWPTLTELHTKLFGKPFDDAHDAAYDVEATTRCFFGLISNQWFKPLHDVPMAEVKYEAPVLDDANFKVKDNQKKEVEDRLKKVSSADVGRLAGVDYTHLHCHSQFSILQSTTEVANLVKAAKSFDMKAIAVTDHGNMMSAFRFVGEALKAGIKPIVGCELNVCGDRTNKKVKDDGYQQVILAKNKKGYHNLAKLASAAFVEGFYYVPRIDKEILKQYKGDLIVTTGGLWSEIPSLILNVGEAQAEEAFVWWKEQFGEDFYVELNRHGIEEEEVVNKKLLEFATKYDVKYIAANNNYYIDRQNAQAHDVLLCVKDGEIIHKPKMYLGKKGREYRFGLPNEEFYIKSPDEMKKLFSDLPEAIINTNEVVDKVEEYKLERDVLLPKFDIPEQFQDPNDTSELKLGENNFLRHLTYEGAAKRYEEITPDIEERLDFELATIRNTGYPGYFL